MKKQSYNEIRNSWYMTTKIGKLYRKSCGQITTIYDYIKDKKICGCSLTKYVTSIDVNKSTGSESTRYFSLDEMFRGVEFPDDCKFIDIGCGKGRVLAYLSSKGFKGQLYGIEHNPNVANYTKQWADKKDNISILSGDAFNLNLDDYDYIYLNRPFTEDIFIQFVNKIENDLTHPLTMICYADLYMSKNIKGRSNWKKIKRDYVFKKGTLAYSYYPLVYTFWSYNP